MAAENIRLIVLAHTKFGENALALQTLSEAYGRRSFLVRVGPKTPMALFLPLNILEADIVPNPKSDLWAARNFRPLAPLSGIRDNYYKNTISLFMSEVLLRTLHDGVREEGLYAWCERQVLTLDALDADFSNYPIRFLLEFAVALGFQPGEEDLLPLAGEHYRVLADFLRSDFSHSMLIPLGGAQRNAIAELLIRYLEIHTEAAINVRSLAVLREIYQ